VLIKLIRPMLNALKLGWETGPKGHQSEGSLVRRVMVSVRGRILA